ncbi:MAG TPA: RIO1 family regulatory kinase/ATPase [Anaerolineales bacterium]|nr:RIO1 family regulatory kinase/ATPase [Anaerolineales bacterium]
MDTKHYLSLLDELDDLEQTEQIWNKKKRRNKYPARHPQKPDAQTRALIRTQDDTGQNFKFTYQAARFEESWLLESLGAFYEHRWISDVLRRVKGGKEASVYLCVAGAEVSARLLAAKVYRPRQLRNLKNDALYRVGRRDLDQDGNRIVDDGMLKALHHRTGYGEQLRHQSWIAHEFQALKTLQAAGADVPEPYAAEHNAILMDYVGDRSASAPTLNTITMEPAEARLLFDRVIDNVNLMLQQHYVHGDLSAYNILYWQGNIRLIDFPQIVSPADNPAAWEIFRRDVARVCQYFGSQGVPSDPRTLAADLWRSHGYKIADHVPRNGPPLT